MKRWKALKLALSFSLLLPGFTSGIAYGADEAEHDGRAPIKIPTVSNPKDQVHSTAEWVIKEEIEKQTAEINDKGKKDGKDNWKDDEKGNPNEIPIYTDEEILALKWGTLTPETVVKLYHEFDRETLLIAAHFYPNLRDFLSRKEKTALAKKNDKPILQELKKLSKEQKALLDKYTPAVEQINKQWEDGTFAADAIASPELTGDIKFSEKQMKHVYQRPNTQNPVDDFYRSANVVETDLALQGKHGMDLVIQRQYNSLDSKTRIPTVEYDADTDDWDNQKDSELFFNEFLPFARGWTFNIPTFTYTDTFAFEVAEFFDGDKVRYYLEEDEIDRYTITLDDGTTLIYENGTFLNHPYEGIDFDVNVSGKSFELRLNGMEYDFYKSSDSDSLTVHKTNAYGDTIKYRMYKDDTEDNVVEIEDTYGRFVVMERDSGGGITNLKLYKNETDKNNEENEIKELDYNIEYSNSSDPDNSSYSKLLSVEEGDGTTDSLVAEYTYDTRNAEFNLISNYVFDEDDDNFDFESDDYLDEDYENRSKTLNYLLLTDVNYPVSGLKMKYYYSTYDSDPTNPSSRGVVRLYQDDNILSYISYHPVSYVDFIYTPYGEEEGPQFFKEYSMYDLESEYTWEIWKKPRTWSFHRLKNADDRHGDIISTIEYPSHGYSVESTYQTDEFGNHLLRRKQTEIFSAKPTLTATDGSTTYSFQPIEAVSYAYEPSFNEEGHEVHGSLKPIYEFHFIPNQVDAAVNKFLMNPKLNEDGTLKTDTTTKSKLSQYANITTYDYNNYGDINTITDPYGVKTDYDYRYYDLWEADNVFRPVNRITTTSADGSLETETEIFFDDNMLADKETTTYTFPTNSGTQVDTITREYDYNSDLEVSQIRETSISGKPGLSSPTSVVEFSSYDNYGHATTKVIKNVKLGGTTQDLITKFDYVNGLDLLDNQTFPDGSFVDYDYDELNRVTSEEFVNGTNRKEKVYTYADSQRKVTVETLVNKLPDPDGLKLVTYFTPQGDVLYSEEVTNSGTRPLVKNNYSTRFDGRLLLSTHPYGLESRETFYFYYSNGAVKSTRNGLGEIVNYNYANTASTSTSYLPQKAELVTGTNGIKDLKLYNRYGHLQIAESETGDQTQKLRTTFLYDNMGQLTSKRVANRDGQYRNWYYKSNLREKTVYLKDPEQNEYTYDYDPLGNLVNIYEDGTLTSQSSYNALSLKLTEQAGASQPVERFSYTVTGDLSSYTDKKGNVHSYAYTPFYEEQSMTVSDASGTKLYTTTNEYDPLTRQLKKHTNTDGNTVEYTYDPYKRMKSLTTFGRTYQMQFNDVDDLMDSLVYPNGPTVSYTYDNLERLSTVTSSLMGTVSYSYSKDTTGETHTVSYPNMYSEEIRLNSFGETTNLQHKQNGTANWTESQTFDGFGNISTINRNGSTHSFTYDNVDRLKTESLPTGERTYTYDGRGNRETLIDPNPALLSNADYTYDALNRLKTSNVNGVSSSYNYYPDGLRAVKTANGQTSKYVYLNGRVIEELDQNNTVKARNIWGSELIYRETYSNGSKDKGGFYLHNSHGDVTKIVDATGQTLNTYDYDVWGTITAQTENMSNPFTFTGEMYDKETGFYYLRARYYDPSVGRFITEDTYKGQVDNPLSLNRYTYVHNNPLRFIDPTGHWSTDITLNWMINEQKMGYANAKTDSQRATYAKQAEDYRKALRAQGYSEAAIMQSSDNMIPNAVVNEIAWSQTANWIENDPYGVGVLVFAYENAPTKRASKVANGTKKLLFDVDLQYFSGKASNYVPNTSRWHPANKDMWEWMSEHKYTPKMGKGTDIGKIYVYNGKTAIGEIHIGQLDNRNRVLQAHYQPYKNDGTTDENYHLWFND
ncbi:RHS repeat domain-containing protein [Brevibacillus dissolubilis]|uniref:RHS repeat domain-containing protein n=1 Tax=Brevibacillus dissolubilis TaxID=1844116 RepID=UPI001116D586|nr:RHS repeat-associated core domain-containing protein [Brevibacillus dissolubilis]